MNAKMWGLILAGAVVEAVAIVILVSYGFGLLKPAPASFIFVPGVTDYLGIVLSIIGLGLIMGGGYLKQ
ncbi:hypothetical protein HS1genome_0603 [Sulfodiicoccus acidiphilus]|uniref:Uncharacterized protein n=1 Tax=Sulfodiicoccus acidiphilus TaxID=1670455 RepID=A0A348B212_9CREN|nr:hypothetical protein [Sulfodiicoccus acidiphilus]BBD72214.1 hypothetical protein HS1genome_0603 [Sulfodiicoccus acidiphilus]GGU02983.1 hypothetical protein GCM10007116_20000 [Sulfodiicoccus acidiphilus]